MSPSCHCSRKYDKIALLTHSRADVWIIRIKNKSNF